MSGVRLLKKNDISSLQVFLPLVRRWHDWRYSLLQCCQNSVFSRWMRLHRLSLGMDEVVSTGSGGDLNGQPIRKWPGVKTVEQSSGVESAGRRGQLFIVVLIPTRMVESSSKYKWWGPTILLRRVFMTKTHTYQDLYLHICVLQYQGCASGAGLGLIIRSISGLLYTLHRTTWLLLHCIF